MLLLVDNFDSFTYNLVDYFLQLNVTCKVVRNNVHPALVDYSKITGMVLSPGPGIPEKAGFLLEYIHVLHQQLPILGICLGQQAICSYFGGKLKHGLKPMHGKISKITTTENPIFANVPTTFQVVRYHSLVCVDLPDSLDILAHSESDEIMAVVHKNLPIWGLQFHPEAALTENGLPILKNWLAINKLVN